MKTGRMKKEGWGRKVLSILQCQTETRAVTRPGIRTVATGRIIALLTSWLASKTRAAAAYLQRRVTRLAEKRRKNLCIKFAVKTSEQQKFRHWFEKKSEKCNNTRSVMDPW